MKLTRTDVSSLLVIALSGLTGVWATTITTTAVTVSTEREATIVRTDASASEDSPLIYVNGERVDEMPDLDPDRIERIEVLKGPAALAVFGPEGSVGVIQIFTKQE